MTSTRVGLVVGIVAGLAWIALPFAPPECAPPTEASEDLCNRLWTPALGGMLAGFVGVFRVVRRELAGIARMGLSGVVVGAALMLLGNASEYWFLNDFPHEGPDGWVRAAAFMTLLLGFAMVLVGSSAFGLSTIRSDSALRWIGATFSALAPATVALAVVNMTLAGVALGGVSVAASTLSLLRPGPPTRKAAS